MLSFSISVSIFYVWHLGSVWRLETSGPHKTHLVAHRSRLSLFGSAGGVAASALGPSESFESIFIIILVAVNVLIALAFDDRLVAILCPGKRCLQPFRVSQGFTTNVSFSHKWGLSWSTNSYKPLPWHFPKGKKKKVVVKEHYFCVSNNRVSLNISRLSILKW